jgi:hypothetical protein
MIVGIVVAFSTAIATSDIFPAEPYFQQTCLICARERQQFWTCVRNNKAGYYRLIYSTRFTSLLQTPDNMLGAGADPCVVAGVQTGTGDHARQRDDQRDDTVDFCFDFSLFGLTLWLASVVTAILSAIHFKTGLPP